MKKEVKRMLWEWRKGKRQDKNLREGRGNIKRYVIGGEEKEG